MSVGDTLSFAMLVIGVIAVLGMITRAYTRRLALRERQLELAAQTAATQAAHAATENTRLEARVRVLERIATGAGSLTAPDLAAEIELLRDAPSH